MESIPALANTDSDLDLNERVSDAISALDVLRGTRAHVNVRVTNGQVTIEGVLQSPMAAAEVERAAADVAGAAGVISHLTDDATLSRSIAEALATDPRTAAVTPGYKVSSVYGKVRLLGHFTAEQSLALAAVCRLVPGMLAVSIKDL